MLSLILLTLLHQTVSSFIKTKYTNLGNYLIYLNIPQQRKYGYYKINQQESTSYINNLDINKNKVIKKDTITFNRKQYERYLLNEEIKIDNYSFPLTVYHIVDPPFLNMEYSGISLSLSSNEDESLIAQLYNAGIISKKLYAFESSDDNLGDFYIGEIPKALIAYKNFGSCQVRENYWGCSMSSVSLQFHNKVLLSYPNSYKTKFQVGYEKIYAPRDFLLYVEQNYLKELFDRHLCLYRTSFDYTSIICKLESGIEDIMPTRITFTFDDYVFSVPSEIMFTFEVDKGYGVVYEFQIVESKVVNDENFWIFGGYFFQNFISVFDYESRSVTLYSSGKIEKIKIESIYESKFINYAMKVVFIICISVISLGFFIISVSSFNKSKLKSTKIITLL